MRHNVYQNRNFRTCAIASRNLGAGRLQSGDPHDPQQNVGVIDDVHIDGKSPVRFSYKSNGYSRFRVTHLFDAIPGQEGHRTQSGHGCDDSCNCVEVHPTHLAWFQSLFAICCNAEAGRAA